MYVLEKRTSVLPFFVAVTDVRSGYVYGRNLSVSIDDIFCGGQCKKTHRTSCVKFLRADTDLRTETKFKSIGELVDALTYTQAASTHRGTSARWYNFR